jgi:hypothetical protein
VRLTPAALASRAGQDALVQRALELLHEALKASYTSPALPELAAPLSNASLLRLPTNGTRLRVSGSNLGSAPSLRLGDYALERGAGGLEPCAELPAACLAVTPAFPHCCFEARTWPGEGSGLGYASVPPLAGGRGYTWWLAAGNQQTPPAPLRYLPPSVSAIASADGRFSTTGQQTITLTGANFGVTRNAERVVQRVARCGHGKRRLVGSRPTGVHPRCFSSFLSFLASFFSFGVLSASFLTIFLVSLSLLLPMALLSSSRRCARPLRAPHGIQPCLAMPCCLDRPPAARPQLPAAFSLQQ